MELKIKQIITQMTLEEKAGLCSGKDFWSTKAVERLGIPSVMVTDGPHGLRKQAGASDHLGLNQSVPATCFPAACTTACSFDTDLLYRMGAAMGEECLQEQVAVLLGPGANIKRSPLCGRNFEYFSEDPYLTGAMATALINGVQSKGVGTSLKHFAANNQEKNRLVIDSVVDERALREIYLTGFETAVKQAQPTTVMCSYNRINGRYSSESPWLLNDVLRKEWGFEGLVVTDWGAINDRVEGLAAGLDLEMPYAGPENDAAIVQAVKSGRLSPDILDRAVERLIRLALEGQRSLQAAAPYDPVAHHDLACEVAARSAVLLKNSDNLLPLKKGTRLAVLGGFAQTPRYQGAGSSRIVPTRLDNLCDILQSRGQPYRYAAGYRLGQDQPDALLLDEAKQAAREAEVCVVCIGLPDAYESEGFDREHMQLPPSHIALLEAAVQANPHTVVLLFGGSAVEMPWLADAQSLLLLYLGGQAGAAAAAQLLFGERCPAGKLAETFPLKLQDNPSYGCFPGGERTVEYRESIFVGYRWYDHAGLEVQFPFGYGLSYTEFAYQNLRLQQCDQGVVATVCIKNIGKVAGEEIVQFYVGQAAPAILCAPRELQGFARIALAPGEEKEVCVTLPPRAFSIYDVNSHSWVVPAASYSVSAAASSRDLRCTSVIEMDGVQPTAAIPPSYRSQNKNCGERFAAADFAGLLGHPLPPADFSPDALFDQNTTVGRAMATQAGAALVQAFQQQAASLLQSDESSSDDTMARMFQRMIADMPLRCLPMFSGGQITHEALNNLLAAMNQERCSL